MKKRKTHAQYAEQLREKNPYIELLSTYQGCYERILCKCKKCGNEWKPKAYSLLNGRGCPACAHTKTSFMEQAFLAAIKSALSDKTVVSRDRSAIGMELDILIPELKVAIEPGSWAFHRKHSARDEERLRRCQQADIRLISIFDSFPAGEPIPNEGIDTLVFPKDFNQADHHHLRSAIEAVLHLLGSEKTFTDEEWQSIEMEANKSCTRKSTDKFIEEVRKLNPDIEVLGDYINSKAPIECKCKKCGTTWNPIPNTLLLGHGCPECAVSSRSRKRNRGYADRFASRLETINPDIAILSDYEKADEKISCKCLKCGNVWSATPSMLLSGYGCPKCGTKKAHDATRKTTQQFKDQLEVANPDIELLGEYSNNSTPILVRCRVCGYEWNAFPKSLLRGSSHKGSKSIHVRLKNPKIE